MFETLTYINILTIVLLALVMGYLIHTIFFWITEDEIQASNQYWITMDNINSIMEAEKNMSDDESNNNYVVDASIKHYQTMVINRLNK